MDTAAFLNRTKFHDISEKDAPLGCHLKLLTMVLYEKDPMRLRGFGVPQNEYEMEAAFALAKLSGFEGVFRIGGVHDHLDGDIIIDTDKLRLVRCCNESLRELFGTEAFVEITEADLEEM